MGKGHLRRMKPVIMPFVAGFVPQQIAVGTCQEETFVGFPRFSPKDKVMAQSGEGLPDGGNCLHHPLILHRRRFAPLQDKGTEAQPIAFMATRKNLLLRQLITGYVPVTSSDAAIEAVIAATVGYFNQSTNEDFIAKAALCFGTCLLQVDCKFCVPAKQKALYSSASSLRLLRSLSIKYFNTFPLS